MTARFAAESTAEDRMIDGMLTAMEEATRSKPGDRSERRDR